MIRCCVVCDTEFEANNSNQKSCSKSCAKIRIDQYHRQYRKQQWFKDYLNSWRRNVYVKRLGVKERLKEINKHSNRKRIAKKWAENYCETECPCGKIIIHLKNIKRRFCSLECRNRFDVYANERQNNHRKRADLALKIIKKLGIYIEVDGENNRQSIHRIRSSIALRTIKKLGVEI